MTICRSARSTTRSGIGFILMVTSVRFLRLNRCGMRWLARSIVFIVSVSVGLRTHAGTLTGTFNSIPAGSAVNLTTNGPLDWVHWGLFTESSIDRKDGVAAQISDFSAVDASNG